jgi:biphenyl 2,3-dioxygenase beta subunit
MLPNKIANEPVAESFDIRSRIELQFEIEQFLYREAELQDDRQFEQWLDLIAEDIRYFMPLRFNRSRREQSIEYSGDHAAAYFDDDKQMLISRVKKLRSPSGWSEDPPSRTRHLVTNVRVSGTADLAIFSAKSAMLIYRNRLERQVDIIAGERRDLLRRTDTDFGFEIVARTFLIDQATFLSNNISFFI